MQYNVRRWVLLFLVLFFVGPQLACSAPLAEAIPHGSPQSLADRNESPRAFEIQFESGSEAIPETCGKKMIAGVPGNTVWTLERRLGPTQTDQFSAGGLELSPPASVAMIDPSCAFGAPAESRARSNAKTLGKVVLVVAGVVVVVLWAAISSFDSW